MKINILNYSAWWKLESSLNKSIEGDQALPDFAAEQKWAEQGIESLLALRGTKNKDSSSLPLMSGDLGIHLQRSVAARSLVHRFESNHPQERLPMVSGA
jgi:hypothetical protein